MSLIYIVANIALGHPPVPRRLVDVPEPRREQPAWNSWRRGSPSAFAALITAMNVRFPISVLTGIVDADDNPTAACDGDVIVDCASTRRRHGVIGALDSHVPGGPIDEQWTSTSST